MTDLMQPSRRSFLRGLGALLAAPAIVRVASVMPVHAPAIELLPVPKFMTLTEELSAITRRAFVPRMFIQIYHASPAMQALIKDAPPDSDIWLKGAVA